MYLTTFHNQPRLAAFDRLLDNWFEQAVQPSEATLVPRVDVREEENGAIVLEAELPGVKKNDIQVSVENGVLKLAAQKTAAKEVKVKNSWVSERMHGRYERSFRLGEGIDGDSVKAAFEDGVLRLELKRKESALPRKIEIG